ncbi:MAG: hypothetical protein R3Y43_06215 [Alphaproteobacteria bacterium]
MKKLILCTLMISLISFRSYASPIMDFPEKILQVINKANETLVLIEKQYQEYQKLKSQIKSGILGSATFQMFKEIQTLYNTGKNMADKYANNNVSVFGVFSDVLGSAEILNNSIDDVGLMYEMSARKLETQETTSAKRAELDTEDVLIKKNNIATLYSWALAIRYKTYLDSENYEEPDVDFKEESSILQAIRAVAQTTVERKVNVLFLESAMLEYYSTNALGGIRIEANDSDETPDEISSSDGLIGGDK